MFAFDNPVLGPARPQNKAQAASDPGLPDSEDAFLIPDRSNYRSLLLAGSRSPAPSAVSPLKTPRKQIYSTQLRHFKEPRLRRSAALTETGRSRISRANCPRWPGSPGAAHLGPQMASF